MSKIQKRRKLYLYAYFLKIFLLVIGLPIILGPFFYNWIWTSTESFNRIKFAVMKGSSIGANMIGANMTPSLILKLLAAIVEGISIALLLLGCYHFFKLLGYFSKLELFSTKTLVLYAKLMRIAFIWTLYKPVSYVLLSLITTANNMPGYRVLSVSVKGEYFIHIIVVGALLIINLLLKEAYELKQEQDLTV